MLPAIAPFAARSRVEADGGAVRLTAHTWCKKLELHVGQLPGYIAAMSIEQIAAEALRLPPKERAMLAESLWESLVDPFEVPASADDSEAVALAVERDRQLESDAVHPISHEEMMARLALTGARGEGVDWKVEVLNKCAVRVAEVWAQFSVIHFSVIGVPRSGMTEIWRTEK
jgi:hypothetical protein